jgi:diacylglycerol kinase (ATP)
MITYFIKVFNSFKYAFVGLTFFIKEERNAKIHVIAAFTAIFLGFYFKINPMEWVAIILSIGFVIGSEAINTALEKLSDIVSPSYNDKIKIVKDIAAAAVLVASIVAFIIALIIFIPKI